MATTSSEAVISCSLGAPQNTQVTVNLLHVRYALPLKNGGTSLHFDKDNVIGVDVPYADISRLLMHMHDTSTPG